MALVVGTVIHVVTREDYDAVINWGRKEGYRWFGNTRLSDYVAYRPSIGIAIEENKQLSYTPIAWFRINTRYAVIDMEEFYDLTSKTVLPPFTCTSTLWPW